MCIAQDDPDHQRRRCHIKERTTMTTDEVTAFLRTMIANPAAQYRFALRCYFGKHNGEEVRAVEATNKRPYSDHTMNKGELVRLVAGKHKYGGEAHVVATKLNGTAVSEWCGAIDAETLYEKLKDRPTR